MGDSWNSSELDFSLSELRKLEEGGEESSCSCVGLDTSLPRASMNKIALCCLICLRSGSIENI